jgi:RNA polymerase sigma-70 factor (ECF subfamily)
LTRGPLNLSSEEVLSAVVERMLKAMRDVRPQTVRQFFALAHQHMRWELNDLARRLDEQATAVELRESRVPAPTPADPEGWGEPTPGLSRILAAIEELPEDERECFNLVRLQGMTKPQAAEVVGVSAKTVERRLNRSLVLLGKRLGDLGPAASSPPPPLAGSA